MGGVNLNCEAMANKFPSLEELLSSISEKTLEKPCCDEHIVEIACELTEWRLVAPHLGLEAVDEENILQNHHDVRIQRREMLRTWRQKFGSKATYGSLAEALYKTERVDLVENVVELLTKAAVTGTPKLGPFLCEQDTSSLLSSALSVPPKLGRATNRPENTPIIDGLQSSLLRPCLTNGLSHSLPQKELEVQIGDWTYSLVKVPSEDSAIVKEQEGHLLEFVDLKSLVQDLGRIRKLVRIAYNGIRAAGSIPEFVELQIMIQDLDYDITKLCDKSAITVAQFKKSYGNILVDLQCTYQYLLDNPEEMAVETLSAVLKLAGSMAKAADELHHDFEKQGEKVKEALVKDTRNTKGQQTHDVVIALKQLSTIMMKAALFWEKLQEHCQSLAESEIQNQVEGALKLPEEKRLKVWMSKGFKKRVIEFYAGWVALNDVCTKYIEQIKLAQRELYEYLTENSTYEQSRRLIPQLVKEFEADLKAAQRAIAYRSTAAKEEMSEPASTNGATANRR